MSVAAVVVLAFWALIIFYPSTEFNQALHQLSAGRRPAGGLEAVTLELRLHQRQAELVMTNSGLEPAVLTDDAAGRAFRLSVAPADGAGFERGVTKAVIGEPVQIVLLPGASYVRRFDVQWLARLKPGNHVLRAIYEPASLGAAAVTGASPPLVLKSKEVQHVVAQAEAAGQ